MQQLFTQFAATEQAAEAGGIAALGLDWQAFLFQLITFVIVLLILRQFVFKKLGKVLDERRTTVQKSLEQAAAIEQELKKTEAKVRTIIENAQVQADEIVAGGHKQATVIVEEATAKAQVQAQHIVAEAKAQIDVEVTKARDTLKQQTIELVALAAGKVLQEKIDPQKDAALIAKALNAAKGDA